MKIRLKRIYDDISDDDGFRILVDRLWPRGVRKSEAAIDLWVKEIAPTTELRKWFDHDPEKWDDFKELYEKELEAKKEQIIKMLGQVPDNRLTLIYSARDRNHNQAVVLKEFIQKNINKTDEQAG